MAKIPRGFGQKRLVLIGLFVAATLGLAYATARERPEAGMLERRLRDAMAPVQYALSQGLYRLRTGVDSVISIGGAQRENRDLRRRLARLTTENVALQEYRRENERWRRLLAFAQAAPYQMVMAQVIGREPESWYASIIINKGQADGLRANMPVVTDEGIVGVIRQVSDRSAMVMLVSDSKSAVGGQIADTRDFVLVEGSSERLGTAVVKPLGAEIRLRAGQEVITSGLGELFPKGLRIGRIQRIIKGRYGLASSGVLIPAVNFSRLEEVAVIVRTRYPASVSTAPPGEGSPNAGP